jgi:hypothetical protein
MIILVLALSAYLGSIRCLRLCQYHSRLSSFTQTLVHAVQELYWFSLMFSVVFVAFVCLIYFLFVSSTASFSSVLRTLATLFEMSLLKLDAQELSDSSAVLVPFCFPMYVVAVVFICMNMLLSIITESYRQVRNRTNTQWDPIFRLMWRKLRRWTGSFFSCLVFRRDVNIF